MPVKKLNELKKGDRGKVVKVSGSGSIHSRLMDMGLITGSEVEMQGVASLGDPIEIRVKGYNLSLRKSEAAAISVEVVQMPECIMPLSLADAGKMLTVIGINAGFGLQRRLADMGLTPGAQVMVVNGCHPGPLLIDIRGSRLGLGFGVAQ